MARAEIHCKHCEEVTKAPVVGYDDAPYGLRRYSEAFPQGIHTLQGDPEITFYRRVRRCTECGELLKTAEVDESLLEELRDLRNAMASLRANADRAAAAVNAVRRALKGASAP